MSYHRVSPGMYQQGRNGPIVKSLHSPDLRGVGIGAFEKNQFNGAPQKLPPNSQVGIGAFEQNQMPNQGLLGGNGINDLVAHWSGPMQRPPPQMPNEQGYGPGQPPQLPNESGYNPQAPMPPGPPMPGYQYQPSPFDIPPDGTSGPQGMNPMQQQMQRPVRPQGLASALMGVSPR